MGGGGIWWWFFWGFFCCCFFFFFLGGVVVVSNLKCFKIWFKMFHVIIRNLARIATKGDNILKLSLRGFNFRVGSILLSGPSCSLGYFPFQPVVHNWFIKGRGMYCSVYGNVHIKDPLLLIEKSSLCGGSGFPSKKCVNVTI